MFLFRRYVSSNSKVKHVKNMSLILKYSYYEHLTSEPRKFLRNVCFLLSC
jgi:hypothetical protein